MIMSVDQHLSHLHVVYYYLALLVVVFSPVNGQQQYFRVQPRNTKVKEGGEALLQCEVGNLAGSVQWAKDGFVLGFSAVIPGFPRYHVEQDRRLGIFNLRLSNVSLEDDDEYQCQVGPIKMNKAIRANANLTVISPPSSVEILDHRHNSKIEIKEHQEFRLECRVRNAKPAATIVWYRGGVEMKFDRPDDDIIEVPGRNGDKRTTRYDTRSRISLKPSADDDNTEYTCEARHEALPQDIPLRATVQLSVLYPPGLPYIEGYTESETVRRGQTVELVCRSRGGNPPAQLIWYKNGEQIRMAYRTAGRVSENVYTFTADASDNKARYKCEASNIMSKGPLKAQVDMTVLFSPAQVTITGSTEARIGDVVPLTCTTANSNPPAEIKWMVAGRQVRNATSRTVVSSDGGWITTSNITTDVTSNRRSLVVICHGLNMQLTENVVSTHTINVLHPPSAPFIHGYTEGTSVPAGTVQRISCTSSGGNPLATLVWYKNDKKVNAIVKTGDKSVTAELTILASATDNEARYRCEASNAATEIPLFETVTMSVYFPPEHVKLRQEPNELKPNEVATLSCDSSSSNPPAKLSWWREGIPVQGLFNTTNPGLHGGTVSSIELKLNITERLNGIVYTCQATNEALQRSVHDAITLQVLYKPVFDSETTDDKDIVGVENEPLVVSLKADGNPSNIVYTWTKDGLPILQSISGSERVVSDGPVLNITRLGRHDAGTYFCEALNSQGSSMTQINVTVQYGASIIATTESVIVGPNKDATLSCTADGNPLDDNTITWRREDFPEFNARTSVMYDKNGTSYLRITSVTREDLGNFECVANNGVGNISTQQVLLIVKHKPEIDQQPMLMKFASNTDDTARLVCRSQASPVPKYTWARSGTPITPNTTGKYYTTFRQLNDLQSESVLFVANVVASDYGNYECIARNEMGFTTAVLSLEGTSVPDTPTFLTVLNVTHDTARLKWTPGFDGGLKSTYRIRYREVDENGGYKYEDVNSNFTTEHTVTGLEMNTQYVFSIQALNQLGTSKFMPDLVSAKTLNKISPPSYTSPSFEAKNLRTYPSFLIILGSIVGILLILMNILLVGCCLHRRTKKRSTTSITTALDHVHKILPDELLGKQDLPKIVIISVSVIGVFLLFINIGVVAGCMIRRRSKRIREQSNQSGKIEMYAPSSYNDTVTGETLSSVSEKSETYSNEEGHNDYTDDVRKQPPATYLIDQPDYPGGYPVCPSYELQVQPINMAHKTHTLPHPHHNHHQHYGHDRNRTKDDQSLDYHGTISGKSSFMSAPSPAPPADGSYYNMSDRYLSYPPPLDFQTPPPIPIHPRHNLTTSRITPPLPVNGSLIRHATGAPMVMAGRTTAVPPPDVLHNTNSNSQILQAQNLTQKRELTSFRNGGYSVGEQEGHLV